MTGKVRTAMKLQAECDKHLNRKCGLAWGRWLAENSATGQGLTEHNVLDYFSLSAWYDNECLTSQFKQHGDQGSTDKVRLC